MSDPGVPQVFAVISSDPLFHHVALLLKGEGFNAVRWPAHAIASLPDQAGPIVRDAHLSHPSRGAALLGPTRMDLGPWVRVISPGDASGPLPPPRTDPGPCFILPIEDGLFRRAVRWGWLGALERRIGALVREAPGFHPCLRAALRRILRQRAVIELPSEGGALPVIRRRGPALVGWLAEELSISPDHLSRLAKRHSLRLKEVDDAWRVLVSVLLRLEEGSWEKAAWRMGFGGGSGLTALIQRTLECCPKDLEREPGFGLTHAEAYLMGFLAEMEGRKSGQVKEDRAG